MNTYICKCGKTVEKSSTAASTGNRLENYAPGHECYGCPFVIPVKDYNLPYDNNIVGRECRMSKRVDYTTFADLKLGSALTGKIRGLDLDFLAEVRTYAESLDGIIKDRYASFDRPTDYGADGRYTLVIMPEPNKKGKDAKAKIFETFFDENGNRLDMAPQAEEDHMKSYIREKIEEAKLAMVDINEAPGLEADELPIEEITEEAALPELEEESTESVMEQLEEELNDDKPNESPQITGRRVSLLNREFEGIVYKIDEMLNRALSIAIDARQGFSVTAKISLSPNGSGPRFSVSHNVGYKFDPIKVEDKGALYEDLAISFDKEGNLIIPDGSNTQITMDEVTAGVTVTTDENGLVEKVEADDADYDRVFPCDCTECPLHTGFTGGEVGCSFGGNTESPLDDDLKGHIYDAVTEHFCTRGVINEICEREFPVPMDSSEAEPDPYPCKEVDCWFNTDRGDEPCCELDEFGCRESHMTSAGDYKDAVIEYQCTRKCVLDRYNKIIGGEQND